MRAKLSERIDSPLEYIDYQFETEEWSNIPSLVPQFILHLNNHLRAIIGHCKTRSKEETTLDLRKDVFDNFKVRFILHNMSKSLILIRKEILN